MIQKAMAGGGSGMKSRLTVGGGGSGGDTMVGPDGVKRQNSGIMRCRLHGTQSHDGNGPAALGYQRGTMA